MPKINRIRITNFSYNNNHRHIIDETFDFYNGENALLSLANGGGKSVLVQTILQPIVPKTKLLGRSISDFFIGKKDPVYIMIEWLLDDGAGFLLTGIGISPSMNYNPNADEDNLNLRFYTFSHHYDEGNKYDIKNIPVTEEKNSGIIVAGYNDIKKLLQTEANRGKYDINYYNSSKDEQLTYERRLNMYSISRNEWKELMVSINQAEHGVSEVFAKCRSSRQVMEQWVIKYIEKVLDKSTEDKVSDHQKLEEMMVQVATAEVENESFIQEYDEIEKFKQDLKKIDNESKSICDLLDIESNKKKELAGIYHFFANTMVKMSDAEEQMKTEIDTSKSEIEHIELEKKSYEIHMIDDEIEKLTKELDDIQEQLDEVNLIIEKQEYELKLQKGAREYEVIEEKLQEKAEQQQILKNTTKNQEELIKEINRIEYSLKCLFSKQIEMVEEELKIIEQDISSSDDKKTEIKKQIDGKINEVNTLSTTKGGLEVKAQAFLDYESKVFNNLEIHLTRNPLLGELNQGDIDKVIADFNDKLKNLEMVYRTEQTNISKSIEQIEVENKLLIDISQKIIDERENYSNNENLIKQYEKEIAQIQEIISKYCNERFSLFDKESIIVHLRKNYDEWNHKATISEMAINERMKMINGIREGITYLPATLINALKENELEIYTGEQYLRGLSTFDREKIISKNPLLPYSLIVTDKERLVIQELIEDFDLSQLVPIFNHSNKESLTVTGDNQILSNPSLLKYDQDSLGAYIERIEKQIESLQIEKKEAIQAAEQYIKSVNVVNSFNLSKEDESCLYQKRDEIKASIDKSISEQNKRINQVDKLREDVKKYEDKCREIKTDTENYQKNIDVFDEYVNKNIEYSQDYESLQHIVSQIEKLNKEIIKLNDNLGTLDKTIEKLKIDQSLKSEGFKTIKTNYNKYKEAKEDVVIDETVIELEGRLKVCKEKVSNDVTLITNRIEGIQRDIDRANDNIKRLGLNTADVRVVAYYSKVEEELQNEIDRHKRLKDKHDTNYKRLDKKITGLNGERKPKIESLKGTPILDRSDIKGEFDKRQAKLKETISRLEDGRNKMTSQKTLLSNLNTRIETKIEFITQMSFDPNVEIQIDENTEESIKALIEKFNLTMKKTSASITGFDKTCKEIKSNYTNTISGTVQEAIKGIYAQIDNLTRNYDKYYYLTERISFYDELLSSTMKLMQTKIDQLKHSKNDLTEHAYLEAKNVYDEIPKVVDNSSIEIDGVKKKILDIQYDKIQSDEIAKDRIKDHIFICLDNITKEIKNNEDESKVRKNIIKVLSTKELLNVISNLDNFKVKAYKVDINEKNRRMMSWEDLIVKNSGGEKFVAYFSLLVALISYSRKNTHAIDIFKKKEESKVLIMDNPFGPITSGHLLRPMFDIAEKYNTQLICLSDIKEGAVISSFNLVYNIKIRQNMMRQEYLDIEENNFTGLKTDERLEKAYLYSKVIQMSLLDE
jgi:DNA repair exonuclease SbcCD ATPase subunit